MASAFRFGGGTIGSPSPISRFGRYLMSPAGCLLMIMMGACGPLDVVEDQGSPSPTEAESPTPAFEPDSFTYAYFHGTSGTQAYQLEVDFSSGLLAYSTAGQYATAPAEASDLDSLETLLGDAAFLQLQNAYDVCCYRDFREGAFLGSSDLKRVSWVKDASTPECLGQLDAEVAHFVETYFGNPFVRTENPFLYTYLESGTIAGKQNELFVDAVSGVISFSQKSEGSKEYAVIASSDLAELTTLIESAGLFEASADNCDSSCDYPDSQQVQFKLELDGANHSLEWCGSCQTSASTVALELESGWLAVKYFGL